MEEERKLKMKFAGRFIDLLGQQMYGGPVPSVAELVANSWDADAPSVAITIPQDLTAPDAEIVVKDTGRGMDFEEINKHYLHIGYERRKRGERTPGGRLVMGRKGIGKLAGFGIAEDIVIRSVKDKHVVQFDLNYSELKSKKSLEGYEFTPTLDEKTEEEDGVTVIYRNLKVKQNIKNITSFRKSLGRRFALETGKMKITINGVELTHEDQDFEYRTPISGWRKENVPGFGKVSYWFGFLKNTVQDPELRGIAIFARERMAQTTPFFFNLTGGINGQVGLEYLTGQVKSDKLDAETDYIATDRQTVNWQFGSAPVLEEWGQKKIKELCRNWKKRREESKRAKFKHDYSELNPLIKDLPEQERKDLTQALEKISGLERVEEDEFMIIARAMVAGVKRESVKKIIRRINAADDNSLEDLYRAIQEWDVISAVGIAESVVGKIEIIKQFEKHVVNKTPEKTARGLPDMQDFIKEHPWLLGHDYEQLSPGDVYHEKGVDKWIREVLKETDKEFLEKDRAEKRRFDLLCIKDRRDIVILELMKPGVPADYNHLMRLERYVTRVQSAIEKKGTDQEYSNMLVSGILIADRFVEDSAMMKTLKTLRPTVNAVEWQALLERVRGRYGDYFKLLKEKAPDDPRMNNLENPDK